MTKVQVNGEDGDITLVGTLVVFESDPKDDNKTIKFAAGEIQQLLRSKKNEKTAKIVLQEGKSYLISFPDVGERERFIEAVVRAQGGGGGGEENSGDLWRQSVILQPAVDLGIVTEEELQAILQEEEQRGVVQSLGALESLIDPSTLELKVITEQMENDILREIPALAVVFGRRVIDETTRREFWEEVVRKYFCFAHTFLEEELQKVEETHATSTAVPSVQNLSSLNTLSRQALPHLPPQPELIAEEPNTEEEMLREAEEGAVEVLPHERLFFAAQPLRPLPAVPHGKEKEGETFKAALHRQTKPSTRGARAEVDGDVPWTGSEVQTKLPQEAQDKETLEMLRSFWRGSPSERKPTLSRYDKNNKKSRKESLITSLCLKRVRAVVEKGES